MEEKKLKSALEAILFAAGDSVEAARIAAVLAESRIGILALSTYNTDYILTKAEHFEETCGALERAGYEIV